MPTSHRLISAMVPVMRLTLRKVFGISLFGLIVGLTVLFFLVRSGSEQTLLHSSEQYRELASREVARRVQQYLDEAPATVAQFEKQVKFGLIDPQNVASVERVMLSLLLANDHISEITLTSAKSSGFDQEGNMLLERGSATQVAVLRSASPGLFSVKRAWFEGTGFVSAAYDVRDVAGADFAANSPANAVASIDPTAHLTFRTAASKDSYGQILATDLHWSQLDEMQPELERRVEVSVLKTIEDFRGKFAGVLRVGLMKTQIDDAVAQKPATGSEADPHLVFLCDNAGRLITGPGTKHDVAIIGDDLRIPAANVDPVIAEALRSPALKDVGLEHPLAATSFLRANEPYLCTFRFLPGTQDWIVGIVVPRSYYLGDLLKIQLNVLAASAALMVVIVLAGAAVLRSVLRSHALILAETSRMKEFEFAPARHSSYIQDIEDVLSGLERAKTSARALTRYVDVDLVRQLHQKGEEPVLGGDLSELSVLFTDIKDFTALAEKMTPDELASVLGRYMQVVAEMIQAERGTIDKFIGDAVMAFWNAPTTIPGHEVMACRAAIRCRAALQKQYESAEWGDLPRFETRFGLHRCVASVGNFGAPDRFNYTALGDGINFASRLEQLNKHYGTTILTSESIYEAAKGAFEFRLLDRVAVKGKTEGLRIYELLGESGVQREGSLPPLRTPEMAAYEEAFALYQKGAFKEALELLEAHPQDKTSTVLAHRCRHLLNYPPQAWDGIHVFESK